MRHITGNIKIGHTMALDENTTALVTGASSGIGEATARALRSRGVKVYAAARRLGRLEQLAVRDRDAVMAFGERETGCIATELDVRIVMRSWLLASNTRWTSWSIMRG